MARTSTIPGRTALAMNGLLNTILHLEQHMGTEFVQFMFVALEKPWLVKRR